MAYVEYVQASESEHASHFRDICSGFLIAEPKQTLHPTSLQMAYSSIATRECYFI